MLRRFLAWTVFLGMSAGSPAIAKPPGLPLDLQDGLQPVVAPWQQWNDQLMPILAALPPARTVAEPMAGPSRTPLPAGLSRMPVSVRKQVVGCLLFGIHPLMSLTPLGEALDQPCDHPVTKPVEQPDSLLMERIGIEFTSVGVLRIHRFEMQSGREPLVIVKLPETDLTGSVLANLNKILEADDLYSQGEKHLAAGQIAEALDCFTRAAECCPGSQSAHLAQAAVYRVFARVYRTGAGSAEETEAKPDEKLNKKEAREKRKKERAARKKKTQPIAQIESQPVPPPAPVVNGISPKPALPPVTPLTVQGLDRLEVPTPTLKLRIEEQAFAPDNAGSTEEAEEPWWFLPWYEEWTAPGKSA